MTGKFCQPCTASVRCVSEFFLANIDQLKFDIIRVNEIIETFDVEI
jgi:hypothetical protein